MAQEMTIFDILQRRITDVAGRRERDKREEKELLSHVQRIKISGDDTSGENITELEKSAAELVRALTLREKYMSLSYQTFPNMISIILRSPEIAKDPLLIKDDIPERAGRQFGMKNGLVYVYDNVEAKENDEPLNLTYHGDYQSFKKDFNFMIELINNGPLRTFCQTRLCYLSTKFDMHVLMNNRLESAAQKVLTQTDFCHVIKVDTHVHASGCVHPNDLLYFMEEKIKHDQPVCMIEGKERTLKEVFEYLDLKCKSLNLDMLDVHAGNDTFRRFDKFNDKYNPIGQHVLRDIFFKTDNHIQGKYFAELLKEVTTKLEKTRYQKAEYRLSIYGRSDDEWSKLARWAKEVNHRDVKWIIQVPRLYNVYRKDESRTQRVENFQKMLENIFVPLFKATSDPDTSKELHAFLKHVSGFDSVDDESKSENTTLPMDTPDAYTSVENPPYSYYLYYMYANIAVLNNFRRRRNLPTFDFRPHCGEAGHSSHLAAGFLFAGNIAHGLTLNKEPVFEYLYYLAQIGIAMSPISNNALFEKYKYNPLPEYFSRGLNISLSTDDPMQFHYTQEPLIEEYSNAAHEWNLSTSDLCEIARNSVLQSGFHKMFKEKWVGMNYTREGIEGNDPTKTNVPSIRLAYRYETMKEELVCIRNGYQRLLKFDIKENTDIGAFSQRRQEPRTPREEDRYTLTYLNQMGFGQVARLCFAVAEVPFEDKPKTRNEFKALQLEGPVVLTHGSKTKITDKYQVEEYLAIHFGLLGSSFDEILKIQEVMRKTADFVTKTKQRDNRQLEINIGDELNKLMEYLNQTLLDKTTHGGYIVGEKLSVADLTIFCLIEERKRFKLIQWKSYPKIQTLYQKIGAIPSVAKYLTK